MRDSFSRALLAGIAGFMLFVLAVPGVQGQADLAGAAKREGSVVVCASIAADGFDVIRKIFEGQYGIRGDYFRASSNGTMDRVPTGAQSRPCVEGLGGQVTLAESFLPVVQKVIVGEFPLGITYVKYVYIFGSEGAPLDYVRLSPLLAEAHHVAISAKAPHPNAARLFVDVFTSRLGLLALAKAGEFVLVPGVYPPIKDADKLRIVLMDDLSEQDLKQFRDQIGTLFLKR